MNNLQHIMVITDNVTDFQLLSTLSETFKVAINFLSWSAVSLVAIEAVQPTLVLLSILPAPKQDYAMCQQLKQNSTTKSIPVILILPTTDMEARQAGFSVGADDCLCKPFLLVELIARLKPYLMLQQQKATTNKHSIKQTSITTKVGNCNGTLAEMTDSIPYKLTYQTLPQIEALYHIIFRNLSDAVLMTDNAGQFTFISPNVDIIFGYTPQEIEDLDNVSYLLGEPLFEMAELEENKALLNLEHTIVDKYGNSHVLSINIKQLSVKNGSVLYICRDITEWKQTANALQKSETFLQHAQRIAHLGSWNWNIVTGELYWTDEIYRIFGLAPQSIKITYDQFFAFVHPDDRQFLQHNVDAAIHENKPYSVDHRICLPTGEIRIVQEQGEVIRDEQGSAIEMVGTVLDVTNRKRTEDKLLESNARLKSIVDTAVDGIIIIDEFGTIEIFNIAAEKIFGYQKEEAVGKTIDILIPGSHKDDHDNYIQHYLKTNQKRVIGMGRETVGQRKNGLIFPIELSVSETVLSNRRIFTGIVRDITERKAMQKKLQYHTDFERLILQLSTHFINLSASEFDDGIIYALQQIGGFMQVEQIKIALIGPYQSQLEVAYSWLKVGTPSKLDLFDPKLFEQQSLSDRICNQKDIIVLPDILRLLFSLHNQAMLTLYKSLTAFYIPMLWEDKVIGILGFALVQKKRVWSEDMVSLLKIMATMFANVIARKQASQMLQQAYDDLEQRVLARTAELSTANAELDRASRLKDEFLANMSHELRTPLNGILGMTEVLDEGVYGDLNKKQRKSIKIINESGRHLLALINDVLDVAKIEAGKLTLDINSVDLDDVCKASLRLIKQLALKKQLKVTVSNAMQPLIIQADERRLKQILVNLLTNAVKFTPNNGQIGLEVVADETMGMVDFTVWDTGIGISAEDLALLFQPFTQVDNQMTRKQEGTGLGLMMVQRLAEMHGGGVFVESQLGQGSRFTVSLPWEPTSSPLEEKVITPSSHEALTTPAPVVASPHYTILLADDTEANIKILDDYLRSKKYRVVVARNGIEAVQQAREIQPDLILMDIRMPIMDGQEAIKQLRATEQTIHIPIIAITALAMPGDRERCLEAGANEYMSKPIRLRQLMQTVELLLKEKTEQLKNSHLY